MKRLRALRKCNGETAAHAIGCKRTNLSGYENGHCEPNNTMLIAISDFYKISIDMLLRVNLTTTSEFAIGQLQRSFKTIATTP